MKLNDSYDNLDDFEIAINDRGFLPLWMDFQNECANGLSYERLREYQDIFTPHGLVFDFGLDAEPYEFEII